MKATVAIPCYNGARYIGPVIESVLAQSHIPDEVLVIDDGSTDASAEIVGQYPVKLIRHAVNCGLATARNTAIQHAGSEILAFIDADAIADPQWLATLLQGYTTAAVSGVGGQGIEANIHTAADRWRQVHARQGHGIRPRSKVDFLSGLNMSFRREALSAVGGFRTVLRTNAEDMDMGYRLNDGGFTLVYMPNARVYHQRQDTVESLRRTMYNWYYWAFVVKRANGRNPWSLAVGTLRRVLWSDTWPDLIVRRDLALAKLDIELAGVKLKAIRDARSNRIQL